MVLKKGISKVTSLIVWVFASILGLCLLGAYINPGQIPYFGILSLLTAPLILLNIFILVYCLIRQKKTGFISLGVLILAIPQISNLWAFHPFYKAESDQKNTLKVLTYNVRIFDLYDWHNNSSSRSDIFKTIKEVNPDIISFQEFYSQPNSKWDNIKTIKEELGLKHYYFARELVISKGRQWGIATFSKYPIVNYGDLIKNHEIKKGRDYNNYKAIYTDIAFNQDTIRLINTHLASIYLDEKDYSTIESISDPEGLKIEDSKTIVAKLLKAYKKRGKQTAVLSNFLKNEAQPHPIIICGDFNDLPTSYAYNKLSNNFNDAFLKTNWGAGATYNGQIPAMRIDFMLVDKQLNICKSEIIDLKTSDHFPFLVEIQN